VIFVEPSSGTVEDATRLVVGTDAMRLSDKPCTGAGIFEGEKELVEYGI